MTAESRSPRFAIRKRPRQKRSQIVVDRILTTACALFENEGYAYVSTNRIAEVANVSIGSFYQYFANRESIALAIYERACAKAALEMKRRTIEQINLPLDAAIRAHICSLMSLFDGDRYALFQVLNEVPELRAVAQPISFERLIHQTHQMFLQAHFTAANAVEIARKCYFIEKCVTRSIVSYLDERPDFLSRDEAVTEICQLVSQYVSTL